MAAPPVSNGPISHSPRSQHDRTRREDRHFKFYARWDNLGATLTGRPHDRPWGIYSGYFRDLDGHLWEVIWNPRMTRPEA